MPPDRTCWTLIWAAAANDPAAREEFGRVYLPVVKAYLAARWRGRPADDAVQDVFVECFRVGGLLEKADPERGGFRGFLLAATRNVARRHEAKARPAGQLPPDLPADDTGPESAFDKAWARSLLKEVAHAQEEAAVTAPARKRVELLKLRFHDGLPIRDIAERWKVDSATLHHEYATARKEFYAALRAVVAFHHPGGTPAEIEAACRELLAALKAR